MHALFNLVKDITTGTLMACPYFAICGFVVGMVIRQLLSRRSVYTPFDDTLAGLAAVIITASFLIVKLPVGFWLHDVTFARNVELLIWGVFFSAGIKYGYRVLVFPPRKQLVGIKAGMVIHEDGVILVNPQFSLTSVEKDDAKHGANNSNPR